ncbi:MAG TPA: hypothetical protein VN721_11110, partial [Flavipsychrobacter sp.]|nr:hypothetical protein [Flavipsychrobacter sp.]
MMPLIKRLVIVLITLHFPLILLGQVDSLRQALKNTKSPEEKAYLLGQLSFAISSAHPDSTIILARQGAQIASSMHLEKELATCLSSIGWAYYYLGNNDSSEYYLTRGIQMCHSSGRKKDEARVLINLSTL